MDERRAIGQSSCCPFKIRQTLSLIRPQVDELTWLNMQLILPCHPCHPCHPGMQSFFLLSRQLRWRCETGVCNWDLGSDMSVHDQTFFRITLHEQFMNSSWTVHEQFMNSSWTVHGVDAFCVLFPSLFFVFEPHNNQSALPVVLPCAGRRWCLWVCSNGGEVGVC